jgi:hypothetical protein
MHLWRLWNGIVASHDSPVDISLAARAAVEASGDFPAVKAGVHMSAKKTDCFPGKRQFSFLFHLFIKSNFYLAAKQIGYPQKKDLLFALFICISHDWTTMA